jgi:hypothetical protein
MLPADSYGMTDFDAEHPTLACYCVVTVIDRGDGERDIVRSIGTRGDVCEHAIRRWPEQCGESVRLALWGKLGSMGIGDHYEGPRYGPRDMPRFDLIVRLYR